MAEGGKKDFPPDFKKRPIAEAVSVAYAEALKGEAEEYKEIEEENDARTAVVPPEVATLPEVAEMEKNQQIIPSGEKREFHKDGSEYVDFTEIPKMAVKPEDAPEYIKEVEGTPKDWREKLRGLIEGAKEKTSGLFTASKEFLTNENTTFAEKAKIFGKGTEKLLLNIGEEYRKAPLGYKIALSAALIGGSLATGGASTFVTVLSAAKLGQRSAASLGVYTLVNGLIEKRLAHKEEKGIARGKWDNVVKQLVSGGAALAIFSGIPGLAAKELLDAAGGVHGVVDYWRDMLFSHHAVPGASGPSLPHAGSAVQAAGAGRLVELHKPDVTHLMPSHTAPIVPSGVSSVATVGETTQVPHGLITEPPGTMPEVSVDAVKGQGYEYMMKRLLENPQMANLKAEDYFKPDVLPEQQSDIYKLLKATPESIDKVVHQIASNPEHNFYHADGTNVRIDMGSHMSVNAEGKIEFNNAVQAPIDAPITPPLHPEVSSTAEVPAQHLASEAIKSPTGAGAQVQSPNQPPLPPQATPAVENTPVHGPISAEPPVAPTTPAAELLPSENVPAAEAVKEVDITHAQDITQQKIDAANVATPETPSAASVEPSSIPATSTHPALGEVNPDFKVNALGLPVDVAQAETYFTPKGDVVIFGGSLSPEAMAEKATDIVSKDHSVAVYYETTQPGEHWWQGTVTQINKASWVERSGLFTPVDEVEGPIAGATTDIQVGEVKIINDTQVPELKGIKAPGIDDLKELYKPGIRKP